MGTDRGKIALMGCGNLGQSIVRGWVASGDYLPGNIIATRRNVAALDDLKAMGISVTSDNARALAEADVIVLALKPHNMLRFIREHHTHLVADRHVLISVATGITTTQLCDAAGMALPVYRAMPNIAATVKESVTCICGTMDDDNREAVEKVFRSVGSTVFIQEELMEAATVLGACGIAYVLRFIRAMVQGGVQIGFDAQTASDIVVQTVKGAAGILQTNGEHPEHEIDKVTTPKGCTIEGLNEMEHNGFSSSLIRGIVASYRMIEKN